MYDVNNEWMTRLCGLALSSLANDPGKEEPQSTELPLLGIVG